MPPFSSKSIISRDLLENTKSREAPPRDVVPVGAAHLRMAELKKNIVPKRGHEMSDGFDSDASDNSDVVVENVSYS